MNKTRYFGVQKLFWLKKSICKRVCFFFFLSFFMSGPQCSDNINIIKISPDNHSQYLTSCSHLPFQFPTPLKKNFFSLLFLFRIAELMIISCLLNCLHIYSSFTITCSVAVVSSLSWRERERERDTGFSSVCVFLINF